MPLRIVFFGTPAFAVPSLLALTTAARNVAAVVTQPDRPRGRGQKVSAAPVKEAALRLGIPVFQPERVTDAAFLEQLRSLQPDLGVVVAYGRILPGSLIDLPRLGSINVHASLLPRWRGAAPIHRAVAAGDEITGITIMRVVVPLDAGPTLATARTPISPDETSVELEARLAAMGADLLVKTIDRMAGGPIAETPQDDGQATYARRLERADGRVDFDRPAREIHNAIRGLQPWPLASAMLHGKRLALLASQARPDEAVTAPPGTIVRVEPDALVVATGAGAIRLLRVQVEGRPAVATRDFLNGHPTRAGERLERVPDAST